MKKRIVLSSLLALFVTATYAQGQWELLDPKTDAVLGHYRMMSQTGERLPDIPKLKELVLSDLGCPNPEQSKPARRPCKFQKLYIDPAGDGSPPGRALVEALQKELAKGGIIDVVNHLEDADALFVDHDELMIHREEAQAAREAAQRQAQAALRAAEEREKGSKTQALLAATAKSGKARTYIAYVVQSDCHDNEADFTYTVGIGQTEQNTHGTPWVELITYSPGAFYDLSAQKHDGSECEIEADIYRIRLTGSQVDIVTEQSTDGAVAYIARQGERLRRAVSNTGYGIAGVSWSAP